MATLYVTTNMSTGAGSLFQTVADASAGDVIRFSEDVFDRGETIEILSTAKLVVSKDLTFDGSPFRVVLNGGGNCRILEISSGAQVVFTDFAFIGGAVSSLNGGGVFNRGDLTLNRCFICGNIAQVGGGVVNSSGGKLTICDSAIYGNSAIESCGGLYVSGASVKTEIVRTTIAGNLNGNARDSASKSIFIDSLIADVTTSYGFVAPPSNDYSVEKWTRTSWRSMDFHLLDDGSANPSPYRDAGTVPDESVLNDADNPANFDLDGNWRGRTQIVDGVEVATRSPGAYETIQADLFWIGKDADGNAVESPSWESADGWATSRFATASNATAPPAQNQRLFIEGTVAFADSPNRQNLTLCFAGRSNVSVLSNISSGINVNVQIGLAARLDFETVYWRPTFNEAQIAPQTTLNVRLNWVRPISCIGSNVRVHSAFLTANTSTKPFYDAIYVYRPFKDETVGVGAYKCKSFFVAYGYEERNIIKIEPTTTFHCQTFDYLTNAPEGLCVKWVEKPIRVVLSGVATAQVGANLNPKLYENDFTVELENADSATLNLCGQTLSGNVVGTTTLTGSAVVDGALTTETLQVKSDTEIQTPETATVCVGNLTTDAESALNGSGTLKVAANGTWNDSGTTVNGVDPADYDAQTNALQIIVDDPNGAEPSFRFENENILFTDPAFAADSSIRLVEKYAPGKNDATGSYATIYNSSLPIVDSSRNVYETTAIWDGVAQRTLVDAAPNDGWNFYRVSPQQPIVKGFASLSFEESETRRFAVWAGSETPPPTYYFIGDGDVSQTNAGDWALSADGVVRSDDSPQFDGATVVLPAKATQLRFVDWGANGVPGAALVSFPSRVEIYAPTDSENDISQQLDKERKLVSVDVPTPANIRFFVGEGGTFGCWDAPEGATTFEVQSLETPSKRFVVDEPQFFDANETTPQPWRVRVAAPIYGNVENWSDPFEPSTPLASFEETESNSLTTVSFSIGYANDCPNEETATIKRRSVDSAPNDWTILTNDFNGSDFSDEPPTSAEYVYRVEWNGASDAVWLENYGARRDVSELTCVKETTYATTEQLASETPTFAARIFRKTTGALLRRDEIKSIRYSLFETRPCEPNRTEDLIRSEQGNPCNANVYISSGAFRNSLSTNKKYWTQDDEGFNFAFTPKEPLFTKPGRYVVRTTFEIVLTEERVEDQKRTFCVDFFVDAK